MPEVACNSCADIKNLNHPSEEVDTKQFLRGGPGGGGKKIRRIEQTPALLLVLLVGG